MKFKKIKSFLLVFFCLTFFVFSSSDFELKEFVLENGLQVFVLEDYSSPFIRIEYSTKAGFSKQVPQNVGFFSLYSRLFKYCAPEDSTYLKDLQEECNSDSTRYIITVTDTQFLNTLDALSKAAFSPIFSDELLENQLTSFKKEILENADSIEGFINSSIDSRVFFQSPWKHDSGIYPAIFSKMHTEQARALLMNIKNQFYIPKNSALFISGPVNAEYVINYVSNYFCQTQSKVQNDIKIAQSIDDIELDNNNIKSKKLFVLSDPEFSPDMTQIVVQYTDLLMEQADFAATIMNQENSKLKKALLEKTSLTINSSEYINVASTHTNDNSRIIIQSLLSNKKLSPCKSSLNFVETIKDSINLIDELDYKNATDLLINSFYNELSNSAQYMNMLSLYWAIDDYQKNNIYLDSLNNNFFARPQKLKMQSLNFIKQNLQKQEPYVFVLINSKYLEKYKKEFENFSFEIVTKKNGSWYTSQLYKTLRDNQALENAKEEGVLNRDDFDNSFDNVFVNENKSCLKFYELDNKIQVATYQKTTTKTVCFSAMILGGQISDIAGMYGLESVLVELLSVNVQKVLYQKFLSKELKTYPTVNVQTNFKSSIINIECLSQDLPLVIESFSEGIISSDIIPSTIDSIVFQKKSEQIVKTSSPVFQIYSNAILTLLKNKEFSFCYLQNKDILKNISFNHVLQSYQKLLNANKYKFIITGNFTSVFSTDEQLQKKLNDCFGFLLQKDNQKPFKVQQNNVQKKTKKIKLTHLFLTDVSRDKAGPRPQVLIPTKEFFDPAQFWIYADKNNLAKFNALLNYFANFMQVQLGNKNNDEQNIIIKVDFATNDVPYGIITFLNVKNILEIEQIYKDSYELFFEEYGRNNTIKSSWIKKIFDLDFSNQTLALLIYNYLNDDCKNNLSFLRDYIYVSNFSETDFFDLKSEFEFSKIYKFYSADTK